MVKEVKPAILKTLAYSDVFDYPLKEEELWSFLIGKKISKREFKEELKNSSTIVQESGFYCFLGREYIIKKREKREVISKKKTKIVEKTVRFLRSIPSIQLIGVSGALAMRNAKANDDIDLFIITQRNRLWITRLVVLMLLEFLGARRKREERAATDKVCLNMLVDESSLYLPKDKQDLYSAHEVVQMLPIFEREETYARFIRANLWVRRFLPNSLDIKRLRDKDIKESKNHNFLITQLLNFFELLAKQFQVWHMRKYRTTEVISDHILAFHPFNYREKILKEYNKRLEQYRL